MPDAPTPRDASQPARVVVIGGGFSGTMTAVNLARLADDPLDITVVNDRTPHGRGVAYRRRRPEYLLNVAARNMSAFPDEPDHFVRWVSERPEYEAVPAIDLRERFIPRQTYGDYLRFIAQKYLSAPHGSTPVSSRFAIALPRA